MRLFSIFHHVLPILLLGLLGFGTFSPLYTSFAGATTPTRTPISHIQVTLKGKKYDIHDVTTILELQERLEEASGIPPSQQGRILFQGKSLLNKISNSDATAVAATASLSEAGVAEGDMLNCVPATASTKSKKKVTTAATASTKSSTTARSTTTTPLTTSSSSTTSTSPFLDQMMQSSGIDSQAMQDMVQKMMGGATGAGAAGDGSTTTPPSMQESMQMMAQMMKSPLFTEYMNDPEKLELSRQMILQNPFLKSMMGSMPGMEELLNDKEAWANAMQAAAQMYTQMDSEELMKAMMQGADAANAMAGTNNGSSLFGDGMLMNPTMTTNTPTALDELSEGEE